MTIANGLVLLASTKDAIRIKLSLPKSAPFSQYASYITQLLPPAQLFKNNEQGVWYDPSDISSMYQDAAMTIPVTANGDPIGAMMDLSGNGNHATQTVSASRPTYQTDGILHWLAFDGVDDFIKSSGFLRTTPHVIAFGMMFGVNSATGKFCDSRENNNAASFYRYEDGRVRLGTAEGSPSYSLFTTSDIINDNNYVFSGFFNGGQSELQVDGAKYVGNLSSDSVDGITLGSSPVNSEYINGRIYGVVCVNGTPDNDKITQYLAQKSGVTL